MKPIPKLSLMTVNSLLLVCSPPRSRVSHVRLDKYWLDIENRRKYFTDYARGKGFDPLIAENWYHIPSKSVANDSQVPPPLSCLIINLFQQGLVWYSGSFRNAIMEAFPDVKFDENRFKTKRSKLVL